MPKPALDCHFKSLFEYAPISLWEEDYSAIKLFFDALRAKGIVEHISKIVSDENDDTSQMNESEVILKETIIANQNTAIVL